MLLRGCVRGGIYPTDQPTYVPTRRCLVCGGPLPEDARPDANLCSEECKRIRHKEICRKSHERRKGCMG